MNDQEINRKLALAIGWKPEAIDTSSGVYVFRSCAKGFVGRIGWCQFDFTDWRVAGPIAQRYDCFPERANRGDWAGYVMGTRMDTIYADTPQRAIALAVIAAHEAGVLK